MWSLDLIADAAADALRARDAALREEHAVYGLDAQHELYFHPVIAAGLTTSGFGVLREQPFPHEWFRKLRPGGPPPHAGSSPSPSLALPLPRDRQRCDLVLTPEPDQTLDDSLTTEKQRRAEAEKLEGSLFASLPTSDIAHPTSHIPPESCFYLELKLCGQHTNTSGIPGPNRTYTSDLTRAPLADLKKLAEDHRIQHAGVLLIVFTESEQVARHDINILTHRILDRNWPISSPTLRSFPIPDRMGNTVCTICLIGMWKK